MGLAKRIIPCLDIDNGRVVKGVNFVDIKDAGDPVEIAKRYNDAGADELCFLDITASSDGRDTLLHLVEDVANQVFILLTVGGGVRSIADIRRLLNAGADKVAINTAAVKNPDFINEAAHFFGNQCIVVAIDAKQQADDNAHWQIYTHGGRNPTGLDAVAFAKDMAARGAGELLITSMDRDGTQQGFDNALIRAIATQVPVPVIASGGVGDLSHLLAGIVEGYADAVLAASIFHFGQYQIAEAKRYLAAAGVEVRL